MPKRKTKEEFIKDAKEICNNDLIDFSKVEYKNCMTKVKLICHKKDSNGFEHSEFECRPNDFMNGHFCPKCGRESQIEKRRSNTEEFVKAAKTIHKEELIYDKVEYVNSRTKVCITCPIHGDFWVTPGNFLSGHGCKECGKLMAYNKHNENARSTYIEKANIVHNGFYIYTNTNYINSRSMINVICPKHGLFSLKANAHLNGNGCRLCANEKNGDRNRLTLEEFKERAYNVHKNKYSYELSEYINAYTPLKITCKKHGIFEQKPYKHLTGEGCPYCNQSHLEIMVEEFLKEKKIEYFYQKRFSWLGLQSLDFYLPKHNVAIECQGIQHFQPIDFFGGDSGLTKTKERDERKRKLCNENGIKLIYFVNDDKYISNYEKEICLGLEILTNKLQNIHLE